MVFDLEKVKNYVREHFDSHRPEKIAEALKITGVPDSMVKQAIKEIRAEGKAKHLKKIKISNKILIKSGIVVGVVLLLALVVFSFYPWPCRSAECFVEMANNCRPASYKMNIGGLEGEGVRVYFKTRNCVLTKRVIGMATTEPDFIKEAFLGKEMQCPYDEGGFNPLHLTTLSALINECEGELRNNIALVIS